jgi:hypothetical protein
MWKIPVSENAVYQELGTLQPRVGGNSSISRTSAQRPVRKRKTGRSSVSASAMRGNDKELKNPYDGLPTNATFNSIEDRDSNRGGSVLSTRDGPLLPL